MMLNYNNGLIHGLLQSYFHNGNLEKKGSYVQGKLEGLWHFYYSGGQLKECGCYSGGKKNSYWTSYHWIGKLKGVYEYCDGKLQKSCLLKTPEGEIKCVKTDIVNYDLNDLFEET